MLKAFKIGKKKVIKPSVRLLTIFFFTVLCTKFTFCFGQQHINILYSDTSIHKLPHSIHFSDSLDRIIKTNDFKLKCYKNGFISANVDSVLRRNDSLIYKVTLGPKIKFIELNFTKSSDVSFRILKIPTNQTKKIAAKQSEISRYLTELVQKANNEGYPFCNIQFENISIENEHFKANLIISLGKRYQWLEPEIVGEQTSLSSKQIANYFFIREGTWFAQKDMDLIPSRAAQIPHLEFIKPCELLFTEEGVRAYFYVKSKLVSYFNGTVGLVQNPQTLNYNLSGDLRLKLQNSLKRGELFDLNWRSLKAGSPQLKILSQIPYLFRTPYGITGEFNLIKRDTSFIELKSYLGVNYYFSPGNSMTAFYRNYQSNVLGNQSLGGFSSVLQNSFGLRFQGLKLDYLPNPTNGYRVNVESSVGNRKLQSALQDSTSLAFQGSFSIDKFIKITRRFVFKTTLRGDFLSSSSLQNNELIRFGGNFSQRGFVEDFFGATSLVSFSIEPRFLVDQNSFAFLFYDQSWFESNVQNYFNDMPLGFGAGFSFGTKLGVFQLSYALGKSFQNPILLRDSKIHFGFTAYF